ncbi:plant UBX domain-containing protein 1 isoform X2 [Momordica charantia]|uniref:Plant UBX domain-containing protein 1 isoform X2 n=1 Tax=Momordica charantia TaxID=3673 RepID=A0A6J1BXN5_MOMCH|nr:plant UBX domain-containing protein 1 isoform X2 [Momordica charantia]
MVIDDFYSVALKRRRFTYNINSMADESAKAKFLGVREKFGREIRVFETSPPSSSADEKPNTGEEADDFYEFTAEDYYRVLATRKDEKFLKTRKIREAEEAARRSRITKVGVRVRFPDNHTLEATFHPSETMETLVDLLTKVVAQPELPFYIYTTPPKKQIKDLTQDFYSAGFVPGAIVYFSYDLPEGDAIGSVSYLNEEVMSLNGLEIVSEEESVSAVAEPETEAPPPAPTPVVKETKPTGKKAVKPKWLKM